MPDKRKPVNSSITKSKEHPLGHYHVVHGKNAVGGPLSQVVSEEFGVRNEEANADAWREKYNKPANAHPNDVNLPNEPKVKKRKPK